jgi:hypothetical protein
MLPEEQQSKQASPTTSEETLPLPPAPSVEPATQIATPAQQDSGVIEKARRFEKLEKTWDREEREQLALKRQLLIAERRLELAKLEKQVTKEAKPPAMERNLGAWLAGAGPADLRECSDTERRKVCAIGYTVLVPTIFALISASYAVSTLTKNPVVITLVAIAWSAIILLVDRAIIASYSPFMKPGSKIAVVTLRIAVAVLMGLTVSHPHTHRLLKDTITTQIEAERAKEIEELRKTFAEQKGQLDTRLATASAELDKQRKALEDSYEAKFIRPSDALATATVSTGLTAQEQLDLERRTEDAAKGLKQELADLDARIQTQEQAKGTLQQEIDDWQRQFEEEINGQRSGVAGVGPRARSIQKDQLEWRRADMQRMTDELRALGARRVEIQNSISASADGIRKETERAATERAARIQSEQERVAGLQRQAQTEQMAAFLKNQDTVRTQIQAAIDTAQADKQRISQELETLAAEEKERLEQLRTAPRYDMLAQTLALHHLFEDPKAGGHFALMAYLVLAGLFLAVDTMPILVKFTSKKGEYEIRREQVVQETDQGGVLANVPASLRNFDPNETQDLHQQVFEYYRKEQQRRLWLKEKEELLAKAERDAAQAESQAMVDIRKATKEAEAAKAKRVAEVEKSDPHGLFKHDLRKAQVDRDEEKFKPLRDSLTAAPMPPASEHAG